MKRTIWEIYLQEKRRYFTKRELQYWMEVSEIERLIQLKILIHCPVEKYEYHHKERCSNGLPKQIVKKSGRYFSECADDPSIGMKEIPKEDLHRYELDLKSLFEVIGKNSGMKSRAKPVKGCIYSFGVIRRGIDDYCFYYYDSKRVQLEKMKIIKYTVEPDRTCIFVMPEQDGIYELSHEEMKEKGIYLIPEENYMDWKGLKLDVKRLLEDMGIVGGEKRLSEKLRKEIEKYGYKTNLRIGIMGEGKKKGLFIISIDGIRKYLGMEGMKLLLRLVQELKANGKGWVSNESLIDEMEWLDAGIAQRILRLRQAIGNKKLIENKAKTGYRLSTHPNLVRLDFTNLKRIQDYTVQKILEKIPRNIP